MMIIIIILTLMLKAMDRIYVETQLTGTLHTVYRNPTLHATAACELPCNVCLHLSPTKLSGGTSPRMERTFFELSRMLRRETGKAWIDFVGRIHKK